MGQLVGVVGRAVGLVVVVGHLGVVGGVGGAVSQISHHQRPLLCPPLCPPQLLPWLVELPVAGLRLAWLVGRRRADLGSLPSWRPSSFRVSWLTSLKSGQGSKRPKGRIGRLSF